MKVLLVSSEVAPFAKTGGLADVAGALPIALARLGIDVRVVMPAYRINNYSGQAAPRQILPHIDVALGNQSYLAQVSESTLPGSQVPVYFVHNDLFFAREGLYQTKGGDYPDNARRFAFFCKTVPWLIKGIDWVPDVIHCNDWQTALLPVLLRTDPVILRDPALASICTLLTIHNMAYQGQFPAGALSDLGLEKSLFQPGGLEFYGGLNLLKGGLVFADKLSTVSPTYAREILLPTFGCGLDGVLRERANDLVGILNGIDYDEWNPATDSHLPAAFEAGNMAGKAVCKQALQQELGLIPSPSTPLMVMISRLDSQKGFDILLPVIDQVMALDVQFAVLGTGAAEYEAALAAAAARYPGRMAATLKFDNGLAHRMEAGGDLFLMPSRFEPCGLNQLYSLRYGTLPVVRSTGGLADSVEPISSDGSTGTGFVFEDYVSSALLDAIKGALDLYPRASAWSSARKRAMETDFSWTASAKIYVENYSRCRR